MGFSVQLALVSRFSWVSLTFFGETTACYTTSDAAAAAVHAYGKSDEWRLGMSSYVNG